MVLKIESKYVVRKYELIMLKDKGNISNDEKEELEHIENMFRNIYNEINILNREGLLSDNIREKNNEKINLLSIKKELKKNKLKPSERKEKAIQIAKECLKNKEDRKTIINKIRKEFNVGYTYGYNIMEAIEK
jgi:hypothetical protein